MIPTINRRLFIAGLGASASACATRPHGDVATAKRACDDDWSMADRICQSIKEPSFAERDYLITEFGAVNDGQSDASSALRAAIAACHAAGGGRVVVPAGEFFCGPIHMLSNVNLHLQAGSRLRFSTDPQDYLPAVHTRWEGMELMGFSPLVYAYAQTNIAITGPGELDGQASMDNWWPWKDKDEWVRPDFPSQAPGRDQLMADVAAGRPVEQRRYRNGAYLRPPFVQFYQCNSVLIEGVRIVRAPFWLLNPVLCRDVTVRGVRLQSLGPNSDGCNPESCHNVLIENCLFDTGDDCIAIKSGRNADGRRIGVPSENIVIRGCQMRAGHGGVVVGSEISGGARNIFAENCHMSSPDLERGIRIKTNSVRGGVIEHLRFRNIIIGEVKDALVINFFYEEGDQGAFDPTVRDIVIENLLCQQADRVFQIRGFERKHIESLRLVNAHFVDADEVGVIEHVKALDLDGVTINGRQFER